MNEKDVLNALQAPIVYHPGGWADTVPDWMKEAVPLERLKALESGEELATDIEVAIYLYTASCVAPMSHEWAKIYVHLVGLAMRRYKNVELPGDLAENELSNYEQSELRHLKHRIWIRTGRKKFTLRRKNEQTQVLGEPSV